MITILPIIDRRVIVPRSGLIKITDQAITDNDSELTIAEFNLRVSCLIKISENNNELVYAGYCNYLSERIDADFVEIKNLKEFNLENTTLNILSEMISKDKELTEFSYSEIVPVNIAIPQTFTFCNIKNTDLFCVVRDKGENHFSLPGGTCELWETGEEGAIRETKEEAQLEISNLKILGCNIAEAKNKNNVTVNIFCQPRYYATVEEAEIKEFVPGFEGWEIEERRFVSLDELPNYIKWLGLKNGLPYLEKLKKLVD